MPNHVQLIRRGGHTPQKLLLLLVVVYAIWGSAHLVNKLMTSQMPPLYMAAIRYLTAGTLLYVYARLTGSARPTWREWKATALVGLLLISIANGTLVLALRYVPTSVSALMGGSLPLCMVLLNWLYFERKCPTPFQLIGLGIGLIGITTLISTLHTDAGTYLLSGSVGIWLLLVSSLSWATGVLLTPHLRLPPQLLSCSMQMLTGGSVLMVSSLLTESTSPLLILSAPTSALWPLLYLVLVGSLVGYTSYVWLARHAPPTIIASFGFVNPVVAVGLGLVVAGESLPFAAGCGGVLALAGSYLIQHRERVAAPPTPITEKIPRQRRQLATIRMQEEASVAV
jgi:drug/metabolite transporter (DMT)-like permease